MIRCCDKPELMQPGIKIQVMTNADHNEIGIRSLTSSWGYDAECKFCGVTLTLTQPIINNIKNKTPICMNSFPEFRDESWVMHYADFKFATILKNFETPVYQCLRLNTEDNSIMHIALSKDEEQVNKLKVLNEKNNKNPHILYRIITYKLTETREAQIE